MNCPHGLDFNAKCDECTREGKVMCYLIEQMAFCQREMTDCGHSPEERQWWEKTLKGYRTTLQELITSQSVSPPAQ